MLAAEGKIKTHKSNGTFCAILGQCVYMTCCNSKDRITGMGCGSFEVVNKYTTNTEDDALEMPVTCYHKGCIHWVRVTEKSWIQRWESLANPSPSKGDVDIPYSFSLYPHTLFISLPLTPLLQLSLKGALWRQTDQSSKLNKTI
jgi:hypothetical protein